MTSARLLLEDFNPALATVCSLVDTAEGTNTLARQSSFDDLVLENGLGIDALASMLEVREALKESRCLSDGMDWDSPLVKCSVFFWTCAILKVRYICRRIITLFPTLSRLFIRSQISNSPFSGRVLSYPSANSIRCSNFSTVIAPLSVISLKVTLQLVPMFLRRLHIQSRRQIATANFLYLRNTRFSMVVEMVHLRNATKARP